jgi:hypothetical protein
MPEPTAAQAAFRPRAAKSEDFDFIALLHLQFTLRAGAASGL